MDFIPIKDKNMSNGMRDMSRTPLTDKEIEYVKITDEIKIENINEITINQFEIVDYDEKIIQRFTNWNKEKEGTKRRYWLVCLKVLGSSLKF